jgi:hypothetical protein
VKVLLVEDEAHVAASLKVGLRAEGFVVVHAETGTEGYGRPRKPLRRHHLGHHVARSSGYEIRGGCGGGLDTNPDAPARTANTTRPTPSISAPTTIWSSRFRSWYWSPVYRH